jgi:flavin reductase (DIM6/NTAB) family NADH-FMN oxidoreductase RutF
MPLEISGKKQAREQETTDAASDALRSLHYTLLIVGSKGPSGAHWMVANWGTQASFEPRRFVIALKNDARTLEYAKHKGAFTINLLDAEHGALARDVLKTHGLDEHEGEEATVEAPRLPEAVAGFDCQLVEAHDIGGDHTLVTADVVGGWKRGDAKALMLEDLRLSYAG